MRRRLLGDDHPAVATGLHNLGQLYQARGDTRRAASLYGQALDLRRARLGADHPSGCRSAARLEALQTP